SKLDMLESIRWPTSLMMITIARYMPAVPSTTARASIGVTQSSSRIVIASAFQRRVQSVQRPGAFAGHHQAGTDEGDHPDGAEHDHVPHQVRSQPTGEHHPQP